MKIAVIGHSGAGKSTLTKALAAHYNIPCLYLDAISFNEDFSCKSIALQNELVRDFLNKNESWVIDGNHYEVADERFDMADEVFYLDFNRFFCYKEAIKRYLKNFGKFRESLGAKEHFTLDFQFWILVSGRRKKRIEAHLEHFKRVKGKRYHFKTREELNDYLKDNGISITEYL